MRYMEVSGNQRDSGLCSDDACPCGQPGALIPRGEGYIYISKEVVDFRKDCLTEAEAQLEIEAMAARMGAFMIASPGVFAPILMCEQGARKRGLNLEVAAADAKYWWNTGKVPLRVTPMAGETSSACFIATAVSGSESAPDVEVLRAFRESVLRPSAAGRAFILLYERLSPPLAERIRNRPAIRAIIRHVAIKPVTVMVRRMHSMKVQHGKDEHSAESRCKVSQTMNRPRTGCNRLDRAQ